MKKLCALALFCLGVLSNAQSQWTTSGNNISNSNTGNVGIGLSSPNYKLDVSGVANIDAGVGTGQILRLRLNNGSGYFYADASSDLHFNQRFHVDQPFFPDGGLQFNAYGAGIALNSGPISGVSTMSFNHSGSYIKMFCDYNVYQPANDQGIIVRYGGVNSGIYPRAVFQAYKESDPTEKPFLISAHGFGWLKNSKTDEVAWLVKAAASQTADIEQWQNSSGGVLARISAQGLLGVGTTSPDQLVTIGAGTGVNSLVSFKQNGTTTAYVGLGMDGVFRNQTVSGTELQLRADGSNNFISLYTSTTEKMRITPSGNIGVGTSTPNTNAKLDVNGNIFSNGKIAIGTTDMAKISTYSLVVNGDALFNKVKVKAYANWPDYVFQKDYELPSLQEIENFIKKNNHLPDVPSAAEIEKKGLDIGDNQALLLRKIEELTLYIIEQDKRIKRLEEQMKK